MRLNFFQQYRDAPLSYAWKNSKPDFLETQKCSSTIFLGTVGKNLSNEKKVISLLMHKVHRHPKFCETLKGSPTKFSALWDEKCSMENHDTSPAPLHIFHTFFRTKKILKHRRDPIGYFSIRWDKKKLDKTVTPSLPSATKRSIPDFFETQNVSPKKFFGTVR